MDNCPVGGGHLSTWFRNKKSQVCQDELTALPIHQRYKNRDEWWITYSLVAFNYTGRLVIHCTTRVEGQNKYSRVPYNYSYYLIYNLTPTPTLHPPLPSPTPTAPASSITAPTHTHTHHPDGTNLRRSLVRH